MASNIRLSAGSRRARGRTSPRDAAKPTAASEKPEDETVNMVADKPSAGPRNPPIHKKKPAKIRKAGAPANNGADDDDDFDDTDGVADGKTGRTSRMEKLRQADRKLKQAEMLLNVSRRVAAIESLDEVLETIVEMTTWELSAERGTLFLNDPVTDEL